MEPGDKNANFPERFNGTTFRCWKSAGTVYFRKRWHWDALIQLTLDGTIDQFKNAPPDIWPEESQRLPLFASSNGHPLIVYLAEDDWIAPRDRDVSGIPEVLLHKGFVLNEPRYSTARSIWQHRASELSVINRIGLLKEFQSKGGYMEVAELTDRKLTFAMRMICDGTLTIDLEKPLLPKTPIWIADIGPAKMLD